MLLSPQRSFTTWMLVCLLLCGAFPATAQHAREPVDERAVALIRKHGLDQSQVMDHLGWLTDVYGPRLTGSPTLDDASRWVVSTLRSWGLENAHLDPWGPFGRGWTLQRFHMHVTDPVPFPVIGYPKAWSSGVDGPVAGEVVIFDAESEEDFGRYEGTLGGKIVLVEDVRTLEEPFEPPARRRNAEELLELANAVVADVAEQTYSADALRRLRLREHRIRFLYEENPLAIVDRYYKGDYGTVFVSPASVPVPEGASWFERPQPWDPGTAVLPQITLAAEHYNRIYRLVERGFPVTMSLDLAVTYHDEDPMEYNVVAEMQGTDPQIGDEVVMVGAHLDSWHGGTGATDNAAGCAVMMEVMRILKETYAELGRSPRRTIRIALWTGEEQGLLGSRAYVNRHFAEIPGWGQPPVSLKPEHATFSAYYNLDNGTGKIRGVYLQQNEAVRSIFAAWLAPFHDLGAATLTISNTGGTDHLAFDAAGLPGFQFIQDHMAYATRTHHSNMDFLDHAVEDDLKQAATIIASFVYHTAERDERLPRKHR